jgi:hypothetical protein
MTKDEVQLKALKATDNKQRCGIALGTGVGKTLIGLKTHRKEYYWSYESISSCTQEINIYIMDR